MSDLFKDADVIYSYTRKQAIEDGVLVALPEMQTMAKEAGFNLPIALSITLWNLVEPGGKAKEHGEDWKGRLWDVLWMLRCAALREPNTDLIEYQVIFTDPAGRKKTHTLWAQIGPGDDGETVLTIMDPVDY